MRGAWGGGAVALSVFLASAARADEMRPNEASESGASLGVRTGLMLPAGAIQRGSTLGNAVDVGVPLIVDGGYRISPRWYIGLQGQFALLALASTDCPSPTSCSGWDVRAAVEGAYVFGGSKSKPWIGAGFGYEVASSTAVATGTTRSGSVSGFELLHLTGGIDYPIGPRVRLGPMALFTIGRYQRISSSGTGLQDRAGSIDAQRLHEWIALGGRGVFDL